MAYRLLDEFRKVFEGKRYIHRKSTSGDFVAMHLFEDLHAVAKSKLSRARIDERGRVLNVQNRRRGIEARRGDGRVAGVESSKPRQARR